MAIARITDQPFPVFRLASWEEFLELVTDSPYRNWAFRGSTHQQWPLDTALSRYLHTFHIHPTRWRDQEERILRIFKRKAYHFLDRPPAANDDIAWLALMQHHGAPTRLLDWTWSPYVAAFFALQRATDEGAVWALNPAIQSREVDLRAPGSYQKHFLPGTTPFVWIGEPHMMHQRLIAQSGTFAVPGIIDRPLETILTEGRQGEDAALAKFILPAAEVREKGLRELYRMNITHATLFPDLDGLARSLAYEIEFHWRYDPKQP
jgi:hypothetical protein